MVLTLDEAIQRCKEVAAENEKFCYKKGGEGGYFNEDTDWNNAKCAAEHRQLSAWLKDYKRLLEREPCEDAISRQAAIDALDKRFDSIPMEQTVEILQLRKDLRELPSAQPERKKSDWIPCSEPPKNEGTYLVYAPGYMGGSSSAKENHNGVMFSNYKNGKWSIGHGYYKRPNCIKAWMPLPELYKAESEK